MLLAGVLVTSAIQPATARAESLDQAQAAVAAATDRVHILRPRVDRALADYEASLAALAGGVSRSISADQAADAAAQKAQRRQDEAGDRVRALYMSGGAAVLVASVLDATSGGDGMRRVAYVRRLVEQGTTAAREGATVTVRLRDRAGRLGAAADARVVRASEVKQKYQELAGALAAVTGQVKDLSDRARTIAEAQALLAQVAALQAAAEAAGMAQVSTARAGAIPEHFRRLYVQAAKTCPGMSWSLLAAVGQVESGHGVNPGVSFAGAQGPMQFMPGTFAAYAVDGDRDGDTEISDPADSVFSAARYLCANGAGRGGPALERAIWQYNHAGWYVQLVLNLAAQYADRGAD